MPGRRPGGVVAIIYQISREGEFSRDFGLKDQIQRAAVSAMSNIAEGFERGSPADFHRFLVIAKASCAEVRSQCYVALDTGYLSQDQFKMVDEKLVELSRVIGGLRRAVMKKCWVLGAGCWVLSTN